MEKGEGGKREKREKYFLEIVKNREREGERIRNKVFVNG